MSKFTKIVILVVVLLAIIGVYYWQKNKSAQVPGEPIKIGILLPLTGDGAVFGEKLKRGMDLLGPNYSKDKAAFIYEDIGGYDIKGAINAATKLLQIDKVDVLIGPFGPDQTLAVIPLTKDAKTPVFSISLCSKTFAPYPNLFCGYPDSSHQLATMAPFLQKKAIKSMSLVLEQSEYGVEAEGIIKDQAKTLGFTIPNDEFIQPKDKDFRVVVAKIKQSKPDAIFVAVTNPAQSFNLFKQLYEIGYKGIRIAYIDTDPKYLKDYGKIADNVYVPGILPNNYSQSFSDVFKSQYKEDPDLYSAIGHDVLTLVLETLNRDGWTAKNLANDVVGVTSPISAIPNAQFLPDHNVSFPLELWVSKNGEYVKAEY